ncbi:hypothetical protein ACFZCY_29870 [Streptomyces sp. NPDC007983]|uniref:hypothetical protein n=1 Tax=Streptomyces sp. NPDC007983 TaxID=3364800 RepID=UPI0036EF435E
MLVCLTGAGTLTCGSGPSLDVAEGQTVLLPYAAGPARLSGPVTALRCRPPAPGH